MPTSELTLQPTIHVELPPDKVIVDLDEYNRLKRDAEPVTWGTPEVLRQLMGMRRETFVAHVLTPKMDELIELGAIPGPPKYKSQAMKYNANIMRKWLNDNWVQIQKGGW